MAKDLVIGRAGIEGLEKSLSSHFARLGLHYDLPQLFNGDEEVATICALNGASVGSFLQHLSSVEGFANDQVAFAAFERGESKFKNMPWWDNSIWLPFDFPNSGTLEDDPITFIGSSAALLRELRLLRELSPLGLGTKPAEYDLMRKDISAFYDTDENVQLDEVDTVRWIWAALSEGAEIALQSSAALWLGPD